MESTECTLMLLQLCSRFFPAEPLPPGIKNDEIMNLFLSALSISSLQEADGEILHRGLNSINVLTVRQQFS